MTNLPCSPDPENSPDPEASSSIVFEDARTAGEAPSGAEKMKEK